MKDENKFVVVRSGGKSYFGHLSEGGEQLLDVAELVVTMSLTATGGIQKRVTVMGLDYNSGPLKCLVFSDDGTIRYKLSDMDPKDKDALIQDYEAFCTRDNLIQPPKKPVLQ